MTPLRTAVIGVGYLGAFHAQKYASLPGVELVGVADSNSARAAEVAAACGCRAFDDHRALLGQVDAVSVVVPTRHHFEIAREFLANNVHVLVEKPITTTIEQADALISLAEAQRLVLQVGHLERFNPVLQAAVAKMDRPLFVESVRVAPFCPRGTDVNVVLDLMIHDIELIQYLVKAPVVSIDAIGAPVFTAEEDIANARIGFGNGCVANVTASRISLKSERKMRVFQRDAYLVLDFQNRKLLAANRLQADQQQVTVPQLQVVEQDLGQSDPLLAEISSFVEAIVTGREPLVNGYAGRMALETALKINAALSRGMA
ncbi:MAG: Gfo/Idh/MocA family oxidoreductase [Geobacter sp.]